MVQRRIVQLTDDLDGKSIPEGKGGTIRFGLDRQDYEIDLGDRNAKAMRDALRKYLEAARRAGTSRGGGGRSGRPGGGPARDYDPKAVRAWATAQGIQVSQRGRVPAELVARFRAANT